MFHVRLFDISTVSLGMASGIALWNFPQPIGGLVGGAMALATLVMQAQRDGIAHVPPRPRRSTLAPFESKAELREAVTTSRELVRELDATPSIPPANSNLTPYQAGRSGFRLAPETDHAFGKGDTVECIYDGWEEGEILFHGEIVTMGSLACWIAVAGQKPMVVPCDCLVLIEAAQ